MATQTVTTAPWGPQQPYLENLYGRAEGLYGQGGPTFYPGSLTAGFDPAQTAAQGAVERQATAGSPVAPTYQNMLTTTYSGGFLPGQQSNPYLDAMYQQAARPVTQNYQEAVAPGIGAQAASSGRYGSGLFQNMLSTSQRNLADSLGGLAANLYGGSYERERDRMYLGDPTAAAQLGYYDASQLSNVGAERQAQEQRVINEAQARHAFEQERPWEVLGRFQEAISGAPGQEQVRPIDQWQRWLDRGASLASIWDIIR